VLHSNFTQQHVFVVGDGSLFDEGVMSLLTPETDLLVSHVTYSDDAVFLNIISSRDQPDVILVCESGSLDTPRILGLVSSHPVMKELPIVVVRLDNSVVDVYESPISVAGKMACEPQRIIARTGDDLIDTLRRKHNDQ